MTQIQRRQLLQWAPAGLLSALPRSAQAEGGAVLQSLLDERLRHGGVGLAAARLQADGSMELAAAGHARRAGALLGPSSPGFELGSITKTFTALLLADAVLRGELKLDDALEDSLPAGDGLRLRDSAGEPLRWVDVATHRSGLPRLPANLRPQSEADPYAGYGRAELLQGLRAFRPTRRRDEGFEYSNLGFGLLAWLLAERAGRPLAELLQQRVLQPLGLGGEGGMRLRLRAEPAALQGHDARAQPVSAWHFEPALAGAGALLASAAQLARYAQCALGRIEHPLQPAFALCLRPHSELGPGPGSRMGLGWILLEQAGRRMATHDGGTGGFASSLWLDLTQRRAGLVLSNAALPVGDLARHLMDERAPLRDLAAERRAVDQQAQPLTPAQLAELPGVYAASPQFKLTLRVRGEQLFAQASGQGEFELFAKGPRRFFARVAALEIEVLGPAGAPAPALVLHQAGRATPFQREGVEAPSEPSLQAEAIAPLAGVYALNPQFKLTLRVRDKRLFAQASGQAEFELFGKGPRQFFARVTPLEIHFEGETGAAPALRLLQAGREMRFERE